jgi:hypothetical protein
MTTLKFFFFFQLVVGQQECNPQDNVTSPFFPTFENPKDGQNFTLIPMHQVIMLVPNSL